MPAATSSLILERYRKKPSRRPILIGSIFAFLFSYLVDLKWMRSAMMHCPNNTSCIVDPPFYISREGYLLPTPYGQSNQRYHETM